MSLKRNIAVLSVAATLLVTPAAVAQSDPGATGPHAVTVTQYGSYGTSISLGNIPTIEMLAEVRYPTDLANGPYPLVVMLHGRHPSCYATTGEGGYVWPCPSGQTPVPSYKGYDYAAAVLASHGMIVVSISADGINAIDDNVPYSGMDERSALIQYHLDKWHTFATTGGSPFAMTFVGHVDMTRVGTMGHSRGGEGVIWNYNRNQSLGSPYGIRAVLSIAPTDTYAHVANNVPVGVLLGYCDGDVYTLPGRAYLDDARYNVSADNAPKYTFTALGANHNYFNRYWTPDQFAYATNDDSHWVGFCDATAPGNGRLTSAQQRGVGIAYMAAFFRRHLLDANEFDGILRGDDPPPPSAQTTAIYDAYFPGAVDRKDVNRLTATSELTVNTIGGNVTQTGLTTHYALCGDGVGGYCNLSRGRPPPEEGYDSVSSVLLWWTALGATYTNQLPTTVPRDVSNFRTVQFRVALNFNDPQNPLNQDQDFTVRLTDGAGATSSLTVSAYEKVYFPPNSAVGVLNTARFPMNAFTSADITNVAAIDLIFDKKPQGAIVVSDVAFADEGISIAEMSVLTNSL